MKKEAEEGWNDVFSSTFSLSSCSSVLNHSITVFIERSEKVPMIIPLSRLSSFVFYRKKKSAALQDQYLLSMCLHL